MIFATILLSFFLLQDESIESLVEKLGSDNFEERVRASDELARRGRAAMKEIEEALRKANDPKVRKRIQEVLEKILGSSVLHPALLEKTKVSLERKAGPLSEALKELQKVAGVPIVLEGSGGNDPEIEAISAKDLSLKKVLDTVTRNIGGGWFIDTDRVVVLAPGNTPLRIFDVRDMLTSYSDEPRLPMSPDGEAEEEDGDVIYGLGGEDLIALVQNEVEPDSWDVDGRSLLFQSGMLIVRHDPKILARVEQFVRRIRRQFLIEVRFDLEAYAVRPGTRPDPEALRKAAKEGKTVKLVSAFSRTAQNKQRVACASLTHRALVVGYGFEGAPETRGFATGAKANVRCSMDPDGKKALVELEFGLSRLLAVEKKPTEKGDIQVPKIAEHALSTTLVVPSGDFTLLGKIGKTQIEKDLSEIVIIGRFHRVERRK